MSVGGLLTGIAGLLQLAYNGQMQSNLGSGYELWAIAVAVIGGTSITGGRGSTLGVVLAAVLLTLVDSALPRWNVPKDQVQLVIGTLILVAVSADLLWRRPAR